MGVIVYWHRELDACNKELLDLKKKTGECGPEQLNELKTCRVELKNLSEMKGNYKCLHEQNIREDNSKALIKQADDLLVLLSKREDSAAKEAERNHEREKHFRKVEVEARQLVDKMNVLVKEKEDCNTRYQTCTEQLGACTAKTQQ